MNNLHEYTCQFFSYVYLNLSTQKDINFLTRDGREIGTPEVQGSVGSNLADYREKKGTRKSGSTGESGW